MLKGLFTLISGVSLFGVSIALPETENIIELTKIEGGMEIQNDFNDTIIYPSSVYCGSYGWYNYYCDDGYKCVDQESYYSCVREDASKVGLIIGIILLIFIITSIILCCCCPCCFCYSMCHKGGNTNVVVQQQQPPQLVYQQQHQPVYQQQNPEGQIQIV